MKPEVRRLYHTLETSPASVAEMPGARVTLVWSRCCVLRDLNLSTPRLRRYWTQDFETIFAQVAFRCLGPEDHAADSGQPRGPADGQPEGEYHG